MNQKKEDKEEVDILSPFTPEDPEKKKEIDETLKSRMFTRSPYISLKKEGRDIFWKVNVEDKILGRFDRKNNELKRLELRVSETETIEAHFGPYILFNGLQSLPSFFYLKTSNNTLYKVQIMKFSNFQNKGKDLAERSRDYKKQLAKNEKAPKSVSEMAQEEVKPEPKENLFL